MKQQVLNKVVGLIVDDVLEEVCKGRIEEVDPDTIDSTIQRGIDSIETSVYEMALEKINGMLEKMNESLIDKWW